MAEPPLNAAFARLRRALAPEVEDVLASEVSEHAASFIFEGLALEAAGLLEAILHNFTRAAEELGPNATVEEIANLARRIEHRPN